MSRRQKEKRFCFHFKRNSFGKKKWTKSRRIWMKWLAILSVLLGLPLRPGLDFESFILWCLLRYVVADGYRTIPSISWPLPGRQNISWIVKYGNSDLLKDFVALEAFWKKIAKSFSIQRISIIFIPFDSSLCCLFMIFWRKFYASKCLAANNLSWG